MKHFQEMFSVVNNRENLMLILSYLLICEYNIRDKTAVA